MLNQATGTGRGRVFLNLTAEQYAKLKRQRGRQRPWDPKPQGLWSCGWNSLNYGWKNWSRREPRWKQRLNECCRLRKRKPDRHASRFPKVSPAKWSPIFLTAIAVPIAAARCARSARMSIEIDDRWVGRKAGDKASERGLREVGRLLAVG